MNFTDQRRYERQTSVYGASTYNVFRVVSTETDSRGRPISVNVSVLSIGNENTLLQDTRDFLVRHTLTLAVEAGSVASIVRDMGAWLEVENGQRNQVTKHTSMITLGTLHVSTMEKMLDRLINSNEDITPYDIIWSIQLVWPDFVSVTTNLTHRWGLNVDLLHGGLQS